MRKYLAVLLTVIITASLAACGGTTSPGGSSTGEDAKSSLSHPVGIYQFRYIADENGTYVPEQNEVEGYHIDGYLENQKVTLLDMIYKACDVWCFEVAEDGSGTLTDTLIGAEALPVTFTRDTITLEDGTSYPYKMEGDRFWYKAQEGQWAVMEKASQGIIDLIREGKGGSVPLDEAEIGDMVCLGTYEQTTGNDATEPIYWRVLDKKDGSLFLLCDKLLDSFSYDYVESGLELAKDLTWKTSSIREFLNNDFIESCFSESEAAVMQSTKVTNEAYNDYLSKYWNFKNEPYNGMKKQKREDGPATMDKVFLLSLGEVLQYFGEDSDSYPEYESKEEKMNDYPFSELKVNPSRVAYITQAVYGNGQGYYDNTDYSGAWMTRTLCDHPTDETAVVYITGKNGQIFDYHTNTPLFIRPAMWVSAVAVSS